MIQDLSFPFKWKRYTCKANNSGKNYLTSLSIGVGSKLKEFSYKKKKKKKKRKNTENSIRKEKMKGKFSSKKTFSINIFSFKSEADHFDKKSIKKVSRKL